MVAHAHNIFLVYQSGWGRDICSEGVEQSIHHLRNIHHTIQTREPHKYIGDCQFDGFWLDCTAERQLPMVYTDLPWIGLCLAVLHLLTCYSDMSSCTRWSSGLHLKSQFRQGQASGKGSLSAVQATLKYCAHQQHWNADISFRQRTHRCSIRLFCRIMSMSAREMSKNRSMFVHLKRQMTTEDDISHIPGITLGVLMGLALSARQRIRTPQYHLIY